jgi:hypothetical protein
VAVFDDQRRIKVNVVTKEPVLLARLPKGKSVVCSLVLDDQPPHASPDESKMDIDAVSITGTDDDAVIVDSSVKEYCDDVDDGEASTSTVEVIPDELDIDEEFLAEEMDRNYVDSHVSILSALPSNPSNLAIKGAKILKRSLQNYVDSGCPEDNHYAGLTRHSSLAVFLNDPQADDLLARVLDCVVPFILGDMLMEASTSRKFLARDWISTCPRACLIT